MAATAERAIIEIETGPTAAVKLITPADHTLQTMQTAGFVRREIVARPGAWVGITRTPGGSTSAWHHHGDYETYIYIQSGVFHLDYGPDGKDSWDAREGDLLVVPKGAVHRE